jgi:hypothetical protein
MTERNKTHYRKAFKSPYLSSADIVGPTVLTISHVQLAGDQTKKTKDVFNTAHFVEKQLRPGEPLKPMILNAHNSKILKEMTGSHFLEDWTNIPVTIYVDSNVRFGRDTVEGLRISAQAPQLQRQVITPETAKPWSHAIAAYKRDGNFSKVLERADISPEHQQMIIQACQNV